MTVLTDTEAQSLDVLVVCPETGMENVLTKIRKWNAQEQLRLKRWHIRFSIKKKFDLFSALDSANRNIEQSILVPIGYNENYIRVSLAQQVQSNLEIIIRPPRMGQANELNEFPSSSLLFNKPLINVQNTLPALHKSCLKRYFKKKVTIKALRTKKEFEQYFRLRYKVWKEMDYLPDYRDSKNTQWELDYTDRTALPIGAFDSNGKMVACARLVFPSGRENSYVKLIKGMIHQTQDKKLSSNFSYPRFLTHPFDVLDSFKGFNRYYADMVKKRVRVAEVSRVIVDHDYRSYGLGEVIVDSLIALAQNQEQLDLLFLGCKKEHRQFYQLCGFEALKHIESDHFVNIAVPSIAMVRHLKDLKIHNNTVIH